MNTFYHKIRQWTFSGPVALLVSGGLIAYRPADPAPPEPNHFTSTKVTPQPVGDRHTLYIVASNPTARADESLLQISRLQFQP